MTNGRPGATWWQERDDRLRGLSGEAGAPVLPDHVCALLDAVESAFADTGAHTPGWAGRPIDESPTEEEYSRCPDPGKFRIVPARIDAWVRVLVDRGWAQLDTERTVEQRGPHEYTTTTIILRPELEGTVPLTFSITDVTDSDATLTVDVSAGDPPVGLAEIPGCGCDACDSGSAALLEELDQWVLSVVDGSLVVDPAAQLQIRTSFGGHGVGGASRRTTTESPLFVAAPWSPGWSPLPVPSVDDSPFP
ncbi:MAG: DUF6226 family protein [Dietzia sp.]